MSFTINGATGAISTTNTTVTALAGATTSLTIGGTGASAVLAIPSTLEWSGTTGALTVAGGVYVAKKAMIIGDFAVNTNKFTVAASTGNTAIAGTLGVTGTLSSTGNLTASANMALGTTITASYQFRQGGAFSGEYGHVLETTLTAPTNGSGAGLVLLPTFNRASAAGTHALLSTLECRPITTGTGSDTCTVAATTYITGAPTIGTTNYALRVAAGLSSFGGIAEVTNATDASNTTTASLKTAGGLAVKLKTYCGDNIVMTAAKGIDFSATADGTGTVTSEVFSDYEEGTWTPVLKDAAAGNAATAGGTLGRYTKIGRIVYYHITFMDIDTTGLTAGNQIYITGLPFTPANVPYLYSVGNVLGGAVASTTGSLLATVNINVTNLCIWQQTTTSYTGLTVAAITSTAGDLIISGTYEV